MEVYNTIIEHFKQNQNHHFEKNIRNIESGNKIPVNVIFLPCIQLFDKYDYIVLIVITEINDTRGR